MDSELQSEKVMVKEKAMVTERAMVTELARAMGLESLAHPAH